MNIQLQAYLPTYGGTNNGDASHPMALLLEEMGDLVEQPKTGQVRNGIIMEVGNSEILVDIGSQLVPKFRSLSCGKTRMATSCSVFLEPRPKRTGSGPRACWKARTSLTAQSAATIVAA